MWGQSEGTGESEGESGKRTRVWAWAQVQVGEGARASKDTDNKCSTYCGLSIGWSTGTGKPAGFAMWVLWVQVWCQIC